MEGEIFCCKIYPLISFYSPAASAHLAIGELLLSSVSLAKGELFGYRRVLFASQVLRRIEYHWKA
jgi:hypothetical protein